MSNNMPEILEELKRLRSKLENQTAVVVILAVVLAASSLYRTYFPAAQSHARQSQTESWNSVRTALDNLQYDKATDIAQRLTEKTPNYYYGYAYLGYIAVERNHLKDAEGYFKRAYELFPTNENEQRLEAVRKRLAAESQK